MKRALLVLVFFMVTVASHAESRSTNAHKNDPVRYDGHVGEVRLNLHGEIDVVDVGGLFAHRIPYHYSLGTMAEYRAGRCISLGLGADYYGFRRLDFKEFDKQAFLNCVPVYLNAKFITTGRVKFFAELRAGYAIPINRVSVKQPYFEAPYRSIQATGFYSGSGIGLSFQGHSLSIGINNVDIHDANTHQAVLHEGSNRKVIVTDFYFRYSYSFALN